MNSEHIKFMESLLHFSWEYFVFMFPISKKCSLKYTKQYFFCIFVYINLLSLTVREGHTRPEDILEEYGEGNVTYSSTNKNFINILKRKIMKWSGHIALAGYLRNTYKIFVENRSDQPASYQNWPCVSCISAQHKESVWCRRRKMPLISGVRTRQQRASNLMLWQLYTRARRNVLSSLQV